MHARWDTHEIWSIVVQYESDALETNKYNWKSNFILVFFYIFNFIFHLIKRHFQRLISCWFRKENPSIYERIVPRLMKIYKSLALSFVHAQLVNKWFQVIVYVMQPKLNWQSSVHYGCNNYVEEEKMLTEKWAWHHRFQPS